ncbi:hypothetical protein LTR81_007517 [Elasticomyces elasticus]
MKLRADDDDIFLENTYKSIQQNLLKPPTVLLAPWATTSHSAMATSHLLNLPAELRVQILEYLLVKPYSITISSTMENPERFDATWRLAVEPPIARASRQLRREALPMYYGLNTFEVDLVHRRSYRMPSSSKADMSYGFKGAIYWIDRLDTKRRNMIQNILDEVIDDTCAADVLSNGGLMHYRLGFEEV